MYSIKEVSEIMDISAYTLRYYDNEGLLPNLGRTNNRRTFTPHDMEWIYLIKCLRSTGLSLDEIRNYITKWREGDSTIDERHAIIFRQKEKVERELEFIKQQLEDLENKLKYYKSVKRGKPSSGTYSRRVQELIDSHNKKSKHANMAAKDRQVKRSLFK